MNGKIGIIGPGARETVPVKYDNIWAYWGGPVPVELNDKTGFVDINTGTVILPFKYDYASGFKEDLAVVKLHNKYGYIDKTGKTVIPVQYDNAGGFFNGVAEVELNRRKFKIDKTGKEVSR